MLPWTRSAWFRRGVTGLSTAFVAVVLTTSLMAEGSALKRHASPQARITCLGGQAAGRSRPQGGCEGKAIVIQPKTKHRAGSIRVDYAALAREMSGMPRFAKPGSRGLRGPRGVTGEPGRIGLSGAPGHTGHAGPQGLRGANGSVGVAGSHGATGKQGERGAAGDDGSDGRDGIDGGRGPQGPQGDTGR